MVNLLQEKVHSVLLSSRPRTRSGSFFTKTYSLDANVPSEELSLTSKGTPPSPDISSAVFNAWINVLDEDDCINVRVISPLKSLVFDLISSPSEPDLWFHWSLVLDTVTKLPSANPVTICPPNMIATLAGSYCLILIIMLLIRCSSR